MQEMLTCIHSCSQTADEMGDKRNHYTNVPMLTHVAGTMWQIHVVCIAKCGHIFKN